MIVTWDKLSNSAKQNNVVMLSEGLAKDSVLHKQRIFLSHRYLDKEQVILVKSLFESYGYNAFIDWQDESLKDRSKVDKRTARIIIDKIQECDVLVFVITDNFKDSLWMSWELGLFHGLKGLEKIALLPISEKEDGKYIKTEFLQLYPYIDECNNKAAIKVI